MGIMVIRELPLAPGVKKPAQDPVSSRFDADEVLAFPRVGLEIKQEFEPGHPIMLEFPSPCQKYRISASHRILDVKEEETMFQRRSLRRQGIDSLEVGMGLMA